MGKLYLASVKRLGKNKLFWVCMAAVFVCSVIAVVNGCRQVTAAMAEELGYGLEQYFFDTTPVLGLVFGIFSSLFLGAEYSDGTIRNKLIVGHSRSAVYLSCFFSILTAAFFMMIAWLLGGMVGVPVLPVGEIGISRFVQFIFLCFLTAVSFSGIFTCCQMLNSNKAASAVVSILLFLVLLICASTLYNALCEPELTVEYMNTENGMQMSEPFLNPDYVGGTARSVYKFIVDALPTGQCIQIANQDVSRPGFMALSSVVIALATTAVGCLLFRRKNLK